MTYFTAITILTLLFLIAGAVAVASNHTVGSGARRAFLFTFALLFFEATVSWINVTIIVEGHRPDLAFLSALFMSFTFAMMPAVPVVLAHTIMPGKHIRYVMAALIVHAFFEMLNPVTKLVFYMDKNGLFQSGPLYGAYIVVYSVAILYLVVTAVRVSLSFQSFNILSCVTILTCMGAGILIQTIFQRVYVTWTAVAMGIVLFFQLYSDMILRTDSLTKLLNRHAYSAFLASPSFPCAVVLIDVDNFKQVNDTYGHAFGDVCLSTIASLIFAAYGDAGHCYRTGGDEFTVILLRRLDGIDAMGERLAELVSLNTAKDERMPSVSVGYAFATSADTDIDMVIREADEAMYRNKRARKKGRP